MERQESVSWQYFNNNHMYACWVSWKKYNPRIKLTPFSFASHVINICFLQLFFGVLQLFTSSYGHFCFAEREREREGNVDCVNNTCTSFRIFRVSGKFVSPFSCAKTFDQNFIFLEVSRRCLLLYRLHVFRRWKFSERHPRMSDKESGIQGMESRNQYSLEFFIDCLFWCKVNWIVWTYLSFLF